MRGSSLLIVVFILAVIIGLFYWFQLRPAEARKFCQQYVKEKFKGDKDATGKGINIFFRSCLVEKGIKAENLFTGE